MGVLGHPWQGGEWGALWMSYSLLEIVHSFIPHLGVGVGGCT